MELVKKYYRIPETFFFYQNEKFQSSGLVDGTAFGQLEEAVPPIFAFFLMHFMNNEILSTQSL